jgi:hypothetical protein
MAAAKRTGCGWHRLAAAGTAVIIIRRRTGDG